MKYGKYKSNPLFKLTKQESMGIKTPIYKAMDEIRAGNITIYNWMDLYVRMLVGTYIANKLYAKETQEEFSKCLQVILDIEKRACSTEINIWSILPNELELLEIGVAAVDDMQDDCLRKVLLEAYKYADSILAAKERSMKKS